MKRKLLSFVLCLCVLFSCVLSGCKAPADTNAPEEVTYTEQVTPVYGEAEEGDELTLRFYAQTPHVPYLGFGAYSQYMRRQPLTLRENGNGTCSLVNAAGAEIVCDADAGAIVVPDWSRFFDLPLPLEDDALGWKDTATRFARITDVAYEGAPASVTLDFAKYGVRLYADADDVYLPVSLLCNIMTDIATNQLVYNGETLYKKRIDLEGNGIDGYYNSPMLRAELAGQPRPADIVRESYAELCFTIDHFFGHPGLAALDDTIAEMGLDQALTTLGEDGFALRMGLLSSDLRDYLNAVQKLYATYLCDGHCVFTGLVELMNSPDFVSLPDAEQFMPAYLESIRNSPFSVTQLSHAAIPSQRAIAWGEESYHESGATAIIALDSFMPDEAAWAAYYEGKGALPEDSLGAVITGLRRASENPNIKNVIFDLSCNGGGSPDVMMMVLAMSTGQNQLHGLQKITGQKMTFTFETDTNLDGVFDARDKQVKYDFNYGVLLSRYAFSCGNLFPFVIRDGGAVIIGEPSSGGACCVQAMTDADGFGGMISSAQWLLTDAQWNSVEGGCRVDLPIEPIPDAASGILLKLLGVDEVPAYYAPYFDTAALDGMMNEWFHVGASDAA